MALDARKPPRVYVWVVAAHAPPSERALGPTANYPLAHRVCHVVIETPPSG
jgi:hypothetical protein